MSSGEPAARARAIAGIGSAPGVEGILIEALRDPSGLVRTAAVRVLGRTLNPRTTHVLISVAASDLEPAVRLEAIEALARLVEERAVRT